jgi:hypothetical protein
MPQRHHHTPSIKAKGGNCSSGQNMKNQNRLFVLHYNFLSVSLSNNPGHPYFLLLEQFNRDFKNPVS